MAKDNSEFSGALPGRRRWGIGDALILAGLAAMVVLAFWQVAVSGRVFFFRDFATYFYPKRVLAAEAIRSLRVPYWQSYSGCGEPFLGTLEQAIFYPPALIYYLLPMPRSFMCFVLLHLFISGAGAYFMMRVWGVRRAGSALTAFAWAFSPVFVSTIDEVSLLTSLAWLPWCLAFTRRIYQGRGFSALALLAVSFAMGIMAGHPEPVIFIGAIIGVYAAGRTVGFFYSGERGTALRSAGLVACAVAGGVLLAGVQVAPFVCALKYSGRQEARAFTEAGIWSARPSDAVLWFLPRFYLAVESGGVYWRSQYWLKTVYLGAAVPFLAVWTVAAVRRRRNWYFAIIAACGIAFAMGPHSVVWVFLYEHVPGFAMTRFPVKFFLPAAFAMAVLAGFGLDDALALKRLRKTAKVKALVIVVLAAGIVFSSCYFAMRNWDEAIFRKVTPPMLLGQEALVEQAVERYASAQWSFGRSGAVLLAAALAMGLTLSREGRIRRYGPPALTALLFADVALFGMHLNPLAEPSIYEAPPVNLSRVPQGAGDTRVLMAADLELQLDEQLGTPLRDVASIAGFVAAVKGRRFETQGEFLAWIEERGAPHFDTLTQAEQWLRTAHAPAFEEKVAHEVLKETFFVNLNLIDRVPTVNTFEPVTIGWHARLLERMEAGGISPSRYEELAKMWGARVFIRLTNASPGYMFADIGPEAVRARLVEEFAAAGSDGEAESLVSETDFPITKRIVLFRKDAEAAAAHLGAGAKPGVEEQPPLGAAHVVYDDGNTVKVEVEAARPALLFLSDNWYPMFSATVDGGTVPIWRANYAYRAVPVGSGKHTVEFSYRPYDFHVGLAMTGAAVLILLTGAMYARRRKARLRDGSGL